MIYRHRVAILMDRHRVVILSIYRHRVAILIYRHRVAILIYRHRVAILMDRHRVAILIYRHRVAILIYRHRVAILMDRHRVAILSIYRHRVAIVAMSFLNEELTVIMVVIIRKGIEEEVNTMEEDFKHKRKEKERTIQLLMKEVEQCKEENVRLKDIRKKIKKGIHEWDTTEPVKNYHSSIACTCL